ncbi:TlpA disulfide reductase family protein [Mangrovimonas sp. TPBH4]|uniref:TlpA family protein disulfide reductase n=1 Tax=Mangrovimonas sp. TPBH4 TaxID=1645914 RepID=UPI0006B63F57|nr:TlpA disulfide reductase family protein [Mangrovimonas sp. TPBH4]
MNRNKLGNIIFGLMIVLLIIPQTRKPIQIGIHKMLGVFSPSEIKKEERLTLSSYDWQLMGEDDKVMYFDTLKGKVVIINFWATWCPPCIAEMPDFENLYQQFKNNKEVVFLFVTSDKKEAVKSFKEKHDFSFPVYRPMNSYPVELEHETIPRTFFIGREGEIAIDKSGVANWDGARVIQQIENLLNGE